MTNLNSRVQFECESLGRNVLGNRQIPRLWDKVALTDDENRRCERCNWLSVARYSFASVVGDDGVSLASTGGRW